MPRNVREAGCRQRSLSLTLGLALLLTLPLTARFTYAQRLKPGVSARVPFFHSREGTHQLIAMLHSTFPGEDHARPGAAIIIGQDESCLFLLTANHVVREAGASATVNALTKFSPKSLPVEVLPEHDTEQDLALLCVRDPESRFVFFPRLPMKLLGVRSSLAIGSKVSVVGHGNSVLWHDTDHTMAFSGFAPDGVIRFEGSTVALGDSGGGLFDGFFELQGLVLRTFSDHSEALAIDSALSVVRSWGYPVGLFSWDVVGHNARDDFYAQRSFPKNSASVGRDHIRAVALLSGLLGDEPRKGAGVIVGLDQGSVYLVTSNELVREGHREIVDLKVRFASNNVVDGSLLDFSDADLSVAVIGVPRRDVDLGSLQVIQPYSRAPVHSPLRKRLGEPRELTEGSPVYHVGSAGSHSLHISAGLERVKKVTVSEVLFETNAIAPGRLGGALFNSRNELVGVVVRRDRGGLYAAQRIDVILERIRRWRLPIELTRGGFYERDMPLVINGLRAKPSGISTWSKIYGGDWDEEGLSVIYTSKEQIHVSGVTSSFGSGGFDGWYLQLDGSGRVVRKFVYGGGYDDHSADMAWSGEGAALAAGWTDGCGTSGRRPWAMIGDPTGPMVVKTWCEGPKAEFLSVALAPDGGFVIAGYELTPGGDQIGIVWKLSSTGEERWRVEVPEAYELRSVSRRRGGFVAVGGGARGGAAGGSVVVAIDFRGDVEWTRSYVSAGMTESIEAVCEHPATGFVMAGSIQDGRGYRVLVRRVDARGAEMWARDIADSYGRIRVRANAVMPSRSGGILVAGGSDQDAWLMKLYSNGEIVWQKTYGPELEESPDLGSEFHGIVETDDYCIVAVGRMRELSSVSHDLWVVRLNDRGLMSSTCRTGSTFRERNAF